MSERRRFANKVVLVTGASSGIGRACALALGKEGARVVAAGRRAERLEETAKAIRAAGSECEIVTGDVRDQATCEAWVKTAAARFGGLDGLVNAAGVIGSGGLLDIDAAEWDRVMDSNLRSIFLMTKAAARALIERKGSIVNLSSVAGPRPYPNVLAYCVSKAGVDQLTRCAALDLAPHGVRVNAVNPGVVVTELHTVTNAIADYEGFLERSKTTHPLGRVGNVEEVAALVLFLLSDETPWVTGATYAIDGGRALASAR
ncbi:MAG TPA: SDR family oxidoreductase [Candidatus Eisenbacteria bacterium]|nr:SDR family oxidoreductase [Candidatus Eisenbacteria bacterium]